MPNVDNLTDLVVLRRFLVVVVSWPGDTADLGLPDRIAVLNLSVWEEPSED